MANDLAIAPPNAGAKATAGEPEMMWVAVTLGLAATVAGLLASLTAGRLSTLPPLKEQSYAEFLRESQTDPVPMALFLSATANRWAAILAASSAVLSGAATIAVLLLR